MSKFKIKVESRSLPVWSPKTCHEELNRPTISRLEPYSPKPFWDPV